MWSSVSSPANTRKITAHITAAALARAAGPRALREASRTTARPHRLRQLRLHGLRSGGGDCSALPVLLRLQNQGLLVRHVSRCISCACSLSKSWSCAQAQWSLSRLTTHSPLQCPRLPRALRLARLRRGLRGGLWQRLELETAQLEVVAAARGAAPHAQLPERHSPRPEHWLRQKESTGVPQPSPCRFS